jgi:translation initiation factor IF-2
VAADDGVMPQTIEAISHARAAGVPIIVAINKVDKPGVNFDRVFTELTEHGVQSEDWGGETQFVKVSALEGTGLNDLLDAISLQAEVLELGARVEGDGHGIVVEAHLDGARGPIATVMVQDGSLKIGDIIVAGKATGKVRAMHSDQGKRLDSAGPSTPVEIIGLDTVPMAGDSVHKLTDDKLAKEIVALRKMEGAETSTSAIATLDALLGHVLDDERPVVPLILKGDTQGSVEAILESLVKLNSDRVENKIVHKAVGGISESDVRLASTSGAVIIGFNVRLGRGLSELTDRYGVPIKYFSIIYEVVDAIKALMAGKLPPIQTEVVQGHGEVRETIKVPKIGMVAGTAIIDGKVTRNSNMRLIRDDVVIFKGKIGSLRRFKDDVKEVMHGYECGIGIEGCNDIQEGDVIESFVIEEEAATL